MPNTLTNLIPSLVEGFDVVSRELTGFIPSVNRDPRADRVARNQTLYSWAAPPATIADIAPGNVSPQAGDKVQGTKALTITNYKMSDFFFTGEEVYALGSSYGNIVTDMIEQAIRSLTNQMERDIYTAAIAGASRAAGTANTTPFLTTVGASADVRKILDDNGAPFGARSLVVDTTAGAAMRTLQQLTRVNEAGTTMGLRDGELLNLNGFTVRESLAVGRVGRGTGTGYVVNGAVALGATTIPLKTGTGTVVAGEVITIGGNQYVVTVGIAAPGSIQINAPGLVKAAADNDTAVTNVEATRNVGLARNAILFATRLPALPAGGDMADNRQIITDSRSGISLEVSEYRQYRQIRYEVAAAWGVSVIKPEHIAILHG